MPSAGLNKVCIADGSFSPIARKGEIALTPTLTFNFVLHVPKLSCNGKLIKKKLSCNGKGEISLTPTLTLNSVLHVPKLSCNLFSVGKFTQTNNCVAKFFPSYCEFQDLGLGKTIGSAREIKGLYNFDDGAIQEKQVQVAKKVPSVSDEIRPWHWRLGHHNFLT